MIEYWTTFLLLIVSTSAHHDVHLLHADRFCANVTPEHNVLLPSPEDCRVFYKCENGMALPQSCPPGLHWCEALTECLLPMLANCTIGHVPVTYPPGEEPPVTPGPNPNLPTCPQDGAVFANPGDCGGFYICVNGAPVERQCADGTIFSVLVGACIAKETSECIINLKPNDLCPVNGAKFSNPFDCSSYYECVDNAIQIQQCEDQEFNPWFEECVSDDLAHCHTFTTERPTSPPTTVKGPVVGEDMCPGDGFTMPNYEDCHSYWLCTGDTFESKSCPSGLYYSCWDQMCLPSSSAQCEPVIGEDCSSSDDKLANPQDCQSYYECVNNTVQLGHCDGGQEFNAWFRQCVPSNLAYCSIATTTTNVPTPSVSTPPPSETDDICPYDGAKLPDFNDCHSYYVCDHNLPTRQSCPVNTIYSCWDQTCLPPTSGICITNPHQIGQRCSDDNNSLPDSDDCGSYYVCENGTVVEEQCPIGLEYNKWYGKCVQPEFSHCQLTTTTSGTGSTDTTTISIRTTSSLSDTNQTTTLKPCTVNPTVQPSFLCSGPGSVNYTYPSTINCNQYMKCDCNKQLQTYTCDPPQFHYNCETHTCENITHCCTPTRPPTPTVTGGPSPSPTGPTPTVTEGQNPSPTGPTPTVTEGQNPSPTGPTPTVTEGQNPSPTGPTPTVTEGQNPSPTGPTPTVTEGQNPSPTGPTPTVTEGQNPSPTGPTPTVTEGQNPSPTGPTPTVTEGQNPSPTGPTPTVTEGQNPSPTGPTPTVTEGQNPSPTGPTPTVTEGQNPSPTGPTPTVTEGQNPSPTGPTPTVTEGQNPSPTGPTPTVTEGQNPSPTGPTPTVTEGQNPSPTGPTPTVTEGQNPSPTGPTPTVTEGQNPSPPGPTPTVTEGQNPSPTGPTPTVTEGQNPSPTRPTPTVTEGQNPSPTGPTPTVTEGQNPSPTGPTPTVTEGQNPSPTGPTPTVTEGQNPSPTGPTPTVTEGQNPSPTGPTPTVTEGQNPSPTGPTPTVTGGPSPSPTGPTPTVTEGQNPSPTGPTPTVTEGQNPSPTGPTPTDTEGQNPSPTGPTPTVTEGQNPSPTGPTPTVTGGPSPSPTGPTPTVTEGQNPSPTGPTPTVTEGQNPSPTGPTPTVTGGPSPSPTGPTPTVTEGQNPSPTGPTPTVTEGQNPSPTGPTPTVTGGPSPSPTGPTPTLKPCTVNPAVQPSFLCSGPGSVNYTYPHPINCNQYMKCDCNKQLQTYTCDPPQFHYNCETHTCENITHCCSPTRPPTPTVTGGPSPSPTGPTPTVTEGQNPSPTGPTPTVTEGQNPSPTGPTPTVTEGQNPSPTGPTPTVTEGQNPSPTGPTPTVTEGQNPSPTGPTPTVTEGQNPSPTGPTPTVTEGQNPSPTGPTPTVTEGQNPSPTGPTPTVTEGQNPSPTGPTPTVTEGQNPSPTGPTPTVTEGQNPSPTGPTPTVTEGQNPSPTGPTQTVTGRPSPSPTGPTPTLKPCTVNPAVQPSFLCSGPGSVNYTYPHPINCNQYMKCDCNKQLQTYTCDPPQFHYNCETHTCENITHCCSPTKPPTPTVTGGPSPSPTGPTPTVTGGPSPSPTGPTPTATGGPSPSPTGPTPTVTGGPSPSPTGPTPTSSISTLSPKLHCPLELDGVKLANPEDCKTYFTCNKGEIVVEKCPAGEVYSCWDQRCENPQDSTCLNNPAQVGHNCSIPNQLQPNVVNCTGYYQCINGKVEAKFCVSGQMYDPWFEACVAFNAELCRTFPTVTPPPLTGSTLPPNPSETYFTCPFDGAMFPNLNDCNSYYECINGVPEPQNCLAGEIYSCWDQRCEPPTEGTCASVGAQQGNNCTIDGVKVSTTDCTSYYECVNGIIVLNKCPAGEEFNPAYLECYKPQLAHCQTATPLPPTTLTPSTITPSTEDVCPINGAQLPNPLNCTTFFKCVDHTPTLQLCTEGYEYSCWNQTCEPAGIAQCILNGNYSNKACHYNGQKIGNPQDCHSYYVCVNGTTQLQQCPLNLFYNKWFGICLPFKTAHCNTVTVTVPHTTPTAATPPMSSSNCPYDGAVLPDLEDCTKFFECKNNAPSLQSCPAGQKYSCWDQQCTSSETAQCYNSGVQTGLNCSKNGELLPNSQDCGSFYECNNGKVVRRYCFFGFYYNSWYQKCVLFLFSNCKTSPMPSTSTELTTIPFSTPSVQYDLCPFDGAVFPDLSDCTKYYTCINNTLAIQSCPNGQSYSCWDQKCLPIGEGNCINSGVTQVGANCSVENISLSDILNCSSYYQCVNATVVLKHCGPGLEFNFKYQQCYQPDRAHCQVAPTQTPAPSTSPPPTSPSITNDVCPEEGVMLPNPQNCSTFFKCINGVPVLQECADGLQYSCWDQMCEAPDKAQCISEPLVSQNCSKNGEKLVDPTNCHGYLQCDKGIIVHKLCRLNWYYNKWFKDCYPLQLLAHCQPDITVKPQTTVTTVTPGMTDSCPDEGARIADPTDCTQYYQCVKGRPTLKTCGKGQIYSYLDEECKKASEGLCINVGSPLGLSCKHEGLRVQNLQSCTSYYICLNGKVDQEYCLPGFKYSRWYHICSLDLFSHCQTYSTVAPPTTAAPIVTTRKYPYLSCSGSGQVPCEFDCNKYLVCNKNPIQYNCPPGYNYDAFSQSCVLAASAKCGGILETYNGQSCPKDGVTQPNPKDCGSYFICKGQKITKVNCPLFQQYDIWQRKCTLSIFTTCIQDIQNVC